MQIGVGGDKGPHTLHLKYLSLFSDGQESLLEESAEKTFYGSEEEDAKDDKAKSTPLAKRKPYVMDPDHRLLLRNTKPLLQSRNAAVSPFPGVGGWGGSSP